MICCTMLRMLFSLLYILDTVTNDLKIIMTCNYYYLGLIVLCCISIYNFNVLAYNINHNSVCEYRHIHINSFDYTADIPGETGMAIRGLTNDPCMALGLTVLTAPVARNDGFLLFNCLPPPFQVLPQTPPCYYG